MTYEYVDIYREAESKQAVDLTGRKLQSEIKSKEQRLIELGSDLTELQLQLDAEKNARLLQVLYDGMCDDVINVLFGCSRSQNVYVIK